MSRTNEMSLLSDERHRSKLSAQELSYLIYGNKEIVTTRNKLEQLLLNDTTFKVDEMYYLPRNEQYRRALQMAARVEILAQQNKLSVNETETLRSIFQSYTNCTSATTLHTLMVTKNLGLLFTDEQKLKWLKMAQDWRLVGCYAQTELGHGSNLRALETTATYDQSTDEFIIHSPTLSSTKWWPGALARTANFAIVYARLIIHGKDFGVHNFMVQLRSLDDHKPLPGITLGDIGPKIGFNTVDNGCCRFHHVRIPRENMGMRLAIVDRNGAYMKNPNIPHEVLYFTMLQARLYFVTFSGHALAKACTIAIRYSAVRKQGFDARNTEGKVELQVLDYQSQQARLFPLLAAAYAIILHGNQLEAFKNELSDQIAEGNMTMLAVGHAISCGLKVLSTEIACNGIEVCRRACGGHGYLQSSGIPSLLGDAVQFVTAEGENYVLALQVTRAILKVLTAYRSGLPLPRHFSYIADLQIHEHDIPTLGVQSWKNPQFYIRMFRVRFLHILKTLEAKINSAGSEHIGIQDNSIACYRLSIAYSQLELVQSFVNEAYASKWWNGLMKIVLQTLCNLFALTQIEKDAGEFLECHAFKPIDMASLRECIVQLLQEIRPHAVVLVDGFNYSDTALNSTLGRFDGKVYEALHESIKSNRLMNFPEDTSLTEFIRPIQNELKKSRL